MIFSLLDILSVLVPILLAVAYVTLFERKILGSMQRRVGPDTVGIYGLGQPFADALKLLVKETVVPIQSQKILFFIAPALSLASVLIGWAVIPFGKGLMIADLELGWLFSLAVGSISIYGVLFAGWSSNSAYSLLGALRSTAQLISYELAFSGAALGALLVVGSFSLSNIIESQESIWLCVPLLPLFLIFLITCLAELNRVPFDLVESESELVAGFMTEYSAFIFVGFFLFEYCSIILLSSLVSVLFLGGYSLPFNIENFWYHIPIFGIIPLSAISLGLKICFLCFCVFWVRATLPRLRFDQLMTTCWTILLPLIFGFLVLVMSILIVAQ